MPKWTTPSPKMASVITLALLAMFAGVLFGPVLWHKPEFDAAMVQTLLVLLVGSVGYYLGSSSTSAQKSDTIAAQAATAAVVAGVQPGLPLAAQTTLPAAPASTDKPS